MCVCVFSRSHWASVCGGDSFPHMACPEHSSHDKTNISLKYLFSLLQLPTASFPVVVKMGHAHSGMGKVGADDVITHTAI